MGSRADSARNLPVTRLELSCWPGPPGRDRDSDPGPAGLEGGSRPRACGGSAWQARLRLAGHAVRRRRAHGLNLNPALVTARVRPGGRELPSCQWLTLPTTQATDAPRPPMLTFATTSTPQRNRDTDMDSDHLESPESLDLPVVQYILGIYMSYDMLRHVMTS